MENPRLGDRSREARAADGDPSRDSLDRLFALALERLELYVRLRIGSRLAQRVEAADVLQETYVEAVGAFVGFEYRGDEAFVRWLCRIAENRIRALADHHGAAKRRAAGEAVPVSRVLDLARDPATGPLTAAHRAETRETVAAAVLALDESERDVLLMRFFEGRELEPIAAATGRSVSAVRRLIGRATVALGGRLGAWREAAR